MSIVNITDQISITSFRAKISSVFKSVSQEQHRTLITKGDESVVLLSMEDYKELCSWQETAYLMSSEENHKRLMGSIKNIEEGGELVEVDI